MNETSYGSRQSIYIEKYKLLGLKDFSRVVLTLRSLKWKSPAFEKADIFGTCFSKKDCTVRKSTPPRKS